jgi:hypothetical protein
MHNLSKILLGSVIAALSTITVSGVSKAQPAPGQTGFFCQVDSSNIPTTVYQNRQGGQEPWIRWNSQHFSDSGYDPLTRCRAVSGRLENFRRARQLRYITVGRMNNQNVICTASEVNGRCAGLIYTLKPKQDPIRTLYQLLAWREGQAGTPSLFESTGERPYIDVSDRLDEAPDVAAPTPAPAPVPAPAPENVPPQPSGDGDLREL